MMNLFKILKKSKGSEKDRQDAKIALSQKEQHDEILGRFQEKTYRVIQIIVTFVILAVFLIVGIIFADESVRIYIVGAILIVFLIQIVEFFLYPKIKKILITKKESKSNNKKKTNKKENKPINNNIDAEIERIKKSVK